MKHFDQPTIEILRLEDIDIMTASNDRLAWDIHDNNNSWITD